MKLYAIRIFVREWDKACEFYRDTLGFAERFRNDEMGWAEFDLGGPCFGLQKVSPQDPEGQDLVGRFVGVSLQVEDIDAVYQELQDKGVHFKVPPEKHDWGGSLAHFTDPDGNVLTLLG